jgi:two-component system, NarL family, nitrate/nitrite response regulator NarL
MTRWGTMHWDIEPNGGAGRGAGLRLILAWRSPLVRAALAALLERFGHRIVADSGDWPVLAAAEADIAIVDIDLMAAAMPYATGVPTIVIAPSAEHPGLAGAINNAAGLVLGSESTDSLRLCLAAVAGGGRWFDSAAHTEVLERGEAAKDAALLTRRERDVARLVATGQRNRAIAGSLGITEGTVKMHLHNVYAKLGLQSRTQLAMDERMRMRG